VERQRDRRRQAVTWEPGLEVGVHVRLDERAQGALACRTSGREVEEAALEVGVRHLHVHATYRADDERPLPREPEAQVLQQVHAGGIGPLEVLDEQQDGEDP
jgi:hypothetical protein